jgi:ABC-type branched-subunit amino acid transport system substrate-binding protein
MSTSNHPTSRRGALAVAALAVGCNAFDHELPECTTHDACSVRLAAPAMCIAEPAPHCVQLTSEDCATVTGDPHNDRAILIGSLLSTTGAAAATNLARQQAAIMAVEEINASTASGGVLQSTTAGDARKLVMVSCDANANLARAATHLISDLHVPAIVGPNLSQDTLDLTTGNAAIGLPSSAQAGTALFTPAGFASSLATIPDNGLTFMMVPSDTQRVPLLKTQINAVENELKAARSKATIKLAVYYRNDAGGIGTRDGLDSLTINGTTLSQAISLGTVREDAYQLQETDHSALVASYLQFRPDLVVVIGTAETITYFVAPLETAWAQLPGVPRPYYIALESSKVPELLTLVTGNNDLRLRFRGTGIAPTAEAAPVLDSFKVNYGIRWRDANGNPQPATQSGMGPTYDTVYAIALALVGRVDTRGASLVQGLPRLASNAQPCAYDASGPIAPCFRISDHATTLYRNMSSLIDGTPVSEIGTLSRLEWDANGAKANGLVEMWCINALGPKPAFASAGLTYDLKTGTTQGTYVPCGP